MAAVVDVYPANIYLPPIPAITTTNGSVDGHVVARPARFLARNNGWRNLEIGNYGADRVKWSESGPGAKLIHTIGNAHSPYSADVKLRYKDFIVAVRKLLPSWTNTFQFFDWEA